MKISIDLTQCESQEEGIEVAKQFLLGHGYTIIQHSPRYFDYMKDNMFGHFTVDSYGAYTISSTYKPGKPGGTGCQVADHAWEFNLAQFGNALNYTFANLRGQVKFYRDLDDRIANHWDKENITVHYPPTPQSDSDRLGFDNGSQ